MTEDSATARLSALGAERLARVLLDLASGNDDAARMVARLVNAPEETVRRFKAGLVALRRRRLVRYRESGAYANQLRSMLEDLEAGVRDPRTGVELVARFYHADAGAFETCDDSDGLVGDVFRRDAADLFARYASACRDKEWLASVVFDLVREDDYGVRDAVLQRSALYLPRAALRDLTDCMWKAAGAVPQPRDRAERDWRQGHWFLLIALLARQLNDPALLERARRALSPELGTAACLDIAGAWLEAGDAGTALEWLRRIEPDVAFMAYERDRLLRAVHERLGNRDEVERLVWKAFRGHRSVDSLEDLLGVIGEERREKVVAEASAMILRSEVFAPHDARFLLECGRVDDAAAHVVERRDQLDGDQWPSLLPLAEGFEQADRHLAAIVLYRALLDSILGRGQSRIYHHGLRYLRSLGQLARQVVAWREITPHAGYLAQLRQRHGRKRSFWTRYDATSC